MKNKGSKPRASYRGIGVFKHLGFPVFTTISVVLVIAAVLMVLMIPILFFVNVEPQDMLLPPYMDTIKENGEIVKYDIIVGGGVKFSVAAETVTLSDIKAVAYSFLLLGAFVSLEIAAVSLFLGKLARGLKNYGPFDRRNADTVNFIGLTVITSEILVSVVYRLLNYTLIKTFSENADTVRYVFGVSATPLLLGLFILLVGFIYGYACSVYETEHAVSPALPEAKEDDGE